MMFIRLFNILLVVGLLFSSAPVSAQQPEKARPKIPIELYGNIFSVEPITVQGALLSYNQVKAYIPLVLVSMNDPDKERSIGSVVEHLSHVLRAYEGIYNMAIPILAERIQHFEPNRDLTELEHEVADYIRAGQWRALSKKYKKHSKSIPPQILDAQKAHNKYLALLYLTEMVSYSTEAEAEFEIPEEEQHSHDFVEERVKSKKYEFGFGYDRIHIHDATVQKGKPKFPWKNSKKWE